MQSGDSVTGWFAALWRPRSSYGGLYTELPGRAPRERQPAARALLGYAELCTAAAALLRAASAGPAGLGLKEQPLKRISAFNRVTAARHLENPSL